MMQPYVVKNNAGDEYVVLHMIQNTHDVMMVNLKTRRFIITGIFNVEEDFTFVRVY